MYRYTVKFIDEIDYNESTDIGLVAAESYGSAADKVVDFYGRDNVFSVELTEYEDIICKDELMDDILE